jgi:hypothetical protein
MSTFILRIVTKKDNVNQRYPSLEEAKKALADLDLTNTTPGFAKSSDGLIVVNRAEVVSVNIIEDYGPQIA